MAFDAHRDPSRPQAPSRGLDRARALTSTFLKDVGQGMLEVSHNALALVGLLVVAGTVLALGRPDVRAAVEAQAHGWLQARLEARADPAEVLASRLADPGAVGRATAADPKLLDGQQKAVATWISRRYRVALEPIGRLVQESWAVGPKVGIDPTLILAIMAIESSFNPFAQSSMGAQGLMQVMTRVHDDKFEPFGGTHAAFDPVSNLRVGVQVLRECIRRAGSVEGGLRCYVGATHLPDDGGYAGRVMAEQAFLKQVAQGKSVPTTVSYTPPPPATPGGKDAAAVGAAPAAMADVARAPAG